MALFLENNWCQSSALRRTGCVVVAHNHFFYDITTVRHLLFGWGIEYSPAYHDEAQAYFTTLRHCDICFLMVDKLLSWLACALTIDFDGTEARAMARKDERNQKFIEEVEQMLRDMQDEPLAPSTAEQV